MLDKKRIPSPLLMQDETEPVRIQEEPLGRFRRTIGMVRIFGMLLYFLLLKLIGRLDARQIGITLKQFCQKMGVLWIKLGQLLSMRADLFPPELCSELAALQHKAIGFPPEQAIRTISRELSAPLDSLFSQFEKIPCAAASTAQVHRAKLKKEQVWVAIKVRRPNIDKIFQQDMRIMNRLFKFMDRFSILPYMRWMDMLWEMEQVFTEELDYRYEISNQQRLKKNLERDKVYVPDVYESYCSREVMVMEYIEAVGMVDYLKILKENPNRLEEWRKTNGIIPAKIGQNLLNAYLRQVLEDNLFHADLHPGNIYLLKNNHFVLLDFGSVGSCENDMLRKYDAYLYAISTEQYSKAIDFILMMMPEIPVTTLVPMKEDLLAGLHAWNSRCRVPELPYKLKSVNTIFDEMTKALAKYGVSINWSFFKILRGWITMDTSLRELMPEANLTILMKKYMEKRKKRELGQMIRELPGDMLHMQDLIDLPMAFFEESTYKGASVRRMAQVFEGTASRFSNLMVKIFNFGSALCFFCTILFICCTLYQHTGMFQSMSIPIIRDLMAIIPRLDIQVWGLSMLISLHLSLSFSKLGRRFKMQQ